MFTKKLKCVPICLMCAGLLLCLPACGEDAEGTTTPETPSASTTASEPTSVPTATVPPATDPEVTAALLEGDWYHDQYWGDCMDMTQFAFHADGTFSCYDLFMLSREQETPWFTYESYWSPTWYTLPLNPTYSGTYTVENGVLTVSYLAWDDYSGEEYTVVTTYSAAFQGDTLCLTHTETGEETQYLSGTFPDRDAEAPDVEPSPLSGTWISIHDGEEYESYKSNCLFERTMHFYSNGNFTIDDYDWFYMPDYETGEWGWQAGARGYYTDCGTFTFDGTTLVLTYLYNDYIVYEDTVKTYTVSILNDTHLIIDDGWGTYIDPTDVPYNGLEGLCSIIGVEYAPTEYGEGDNYGS